jgi:geranylgeranyl diphosphate synthase type II
MSDNQLFIKSLSDSIAQLNLNNAPKELYNPIDYVLQLGGKRLRPILTLLTCSLYTEDWQKSVDAAMAVEVFHNFTLLHDDIMDNAPLRRGKPSVHEKWDVNTAILSGDVMLIQAYEQLLKVKFENPVEVIELFNTCAREVCEGQQMDMNFETQEDVKLAEYLLMIKYKTAVLLGFAMQLGGIIGGCSEEDKMLLKKIGVDAGLAFQLQDDYLDVYGDPEKFGKQIGGDIIENKKTFLLIKALELAEGQTEKDLHSWLKNNSEIDKETKIKSITAIYTEVGIPNLLKSEIDSYFKKAYQQISLLKITKEKQEKVISYLDWLAQRQM